MLDFASARAVVLPEQTVYEWDQTLDEVNMYIKPPPGITARALDIEITVKHLRIGIKGNPPFLNVCSLLAPCCKPRRIFFWVQEDLGSEVIKEESYWMMGTLAIWQQPAALPWFHSCPHVF